MTPSVHVPLSLREIVITRAQGRCEYCQTPARYSPKVFEIEHIGRFLLGVQRRWTTWLWPVPRAIVTRGAAKARSIR